METLLWSRVFYLCPYRPISRVLEVPGYCAAHGTLDIRWPENKLLGNGCLASEDVKKRLTQDLNNNE